MMGIWAELAFHAQMGAYARFYWPLCRFECRSRTPTRRHACAHIVHPAQGRSRLPYPKKDYWAESKFGALKIYDPPGRVLVLPTALQCTCRGFKFLTVCCSAGSDTIIVNDVFVACAAGRCQGGINFSCSDGYKGNQCSECNEGQFYWQGTCDTKCSDLGSEGAVTVFGIIAVMVVWIVLNKSAGGMCAAIPLFFELL